MDQIIYTQLSSSDNGRRRGSTGSESLRSSQQHDSGAVANSDAEARRLLSEDFPSAAALKRSASSASPSTAERPPPENDPSLLRCLSSTMPPPPPHLQQDEAEATCAAALELLQRFVDAVTAHAAGETLPTGRSLKIPDLAAKVDAVFGPVECESLDPRSDSGVTAAKATMADAFKAALLNILSNNVIISRTAVDAEQQNTVRQARSPQRRQGGAGAWRRRAGSEAERGTQTDATGTEAAALTANTTRIPEPSSMRVVNVVAGAAGRTVGTSQEFVVESTAARGAARFRPHTAGTSNAHRRGNAPAAGNWSLRPTSASLAKLAIEPPHARDGEADCSDDSEKQQRAVSPDAQDVFDAVQSALYDRETGRSIFVDDDLEVEWHENDPARTDRRARPRRINPRDRTLLRNLSKERRDFVMHKMSDPMRRELAHQNAIAEEMERFARQVRGSQRTQSAIRERHVAHAGETTVLTSAASGGDLSAVLDASPAARSSEAVRELLIFMDSVLVRGDLGDTNAEHSKWEGAHDARKKAFNPVKRPSSARVNPSLKVLRVDAHPAQRVGFHAPVPQPLVKPHRSVHSASELSKSTSSSARPSEPALSHTFSAFVAKHRAAVATKRSTDELSTSLAAAAADEGQRAVRNDFRSGAALSWVSTSIDPAATQRIRQQPRPAFGVVKTRQGAPEGMLTSEAAEGDGGEVVHAPQSRECDTRSSLIRHLNCERTCRSITNFALPM